MRLLENKIYAHAATECGANGCYFIYLPLIYEENVDLYARYITYKRGENWDRPMQIFQNGQPDFRAVMVVILAHLKIEVFGFVALSGAAGILQMSINCMIFSLKMLRRQRKAIQMMKVNQLGNSILRTYSIGKQ